MATAGSNDLEDLHQQLARMMRTRLEDTESPPSASELSVIRQFLKDNGIEATPGNEGEAGKLAEVKNLPYPTENDVQAE